MLPSPAMMRCDAIAMDCRPDEQKRFTVIPAVVTDRPARNAIWRAMFPPVAPSGLAQPMITSSTSAESMPARDTACRTACAPRVAPWVMLKAPRHDLQRGVRAVETITASVIDALQGFLVEPLSFARQLREQGRGLPESRVPAWVGGEAFH